MESKLYVVLGMHRSGTSLLAAGLSHIGLNFGNELMGGTQFNLKGHWEDNDIVAFNNRVLNALGMQWDSLEFINKTNWQCKDIQTLVDEGAQLLLRKLSQNNGHFAFKDPRTIRILPIWFKIIKQCDITTKFVVPFRNPLDVGVSLAKRENKPFSYSQLLWMHHHFTYLKELLFSDFDVAFYDFYDFCKKPKEVLASIASFLSVTAAEENLELFAGEFYDEALITKQTDPYQLSENKRLFPFVFDSYRHLRMMSESRAEPDMNLVLQTSRKWLSVGPLLIEQQRVLLEENLTNQQSVRAQERETQLKLQEELTRLKLQADGEKVLKESLEGVKNDLASGLSCISESINQVLKSESELTKSIEYKFNEQWLKITEALEKHNKAVLAELKDTFSEVELFDELASIKGFLIESCENTKQSQLDNILKRHLISQEDQHNSMLADFHREIAELHRKIDSEAISVARVKDEQIRKQKSSIQKLQNELLLVQKQLKQAALDAQNQKCRVVDIESSLSWRLTSPIRSIFSLFK